MVNTMAGGLVNIIKPNLYAIIFQRKTTCICNG